MIGIDSQGEFLSIGDAAALLRVPVSTIRTWVRQGSIRRIKLGRQYFYRPEDLLTCLSSLLIDPFIRIGGI